MENKIELTDLVLQNMCDCLEKNYHSIYRHASNYVENALLYDLKYETGVIDLYPVKIEYVTLLFLLRSDKECTEYLIIMPQSVLTKDVDITVIKDFITLDMILRTEADKQKNIPTGTIGVKKIK